MKTKQSFRIATIAILAIFAVSTCVVAQTARRTTTAKRSQVQAKPWAKFENGTLTFSYGAKPAGKDVYVVRTDEHVTTYGMHWLEKRNEIKKVVFSPSFRRLTDIKSTSQWFFECKNLTTIIGLENLNTANVVYMSSMFSLCEKLTSLNLAHFRTNNVTYMSHMFFHCESLTSLDLSSFNTSAIDFDYSFARLNDMFGYCKSLKTIIVSDTEWNVKLDGLNMFKECPAEVRTQSGKILRPAPTADQGINPNAVTIPPYEIRKREKELDYMRYELYFVGYFYTTVTYSRDRGYKVYFDSSNWEYYDTLDHAAEATYVWKQYGLVRTVGKY